MKKIIDVSKHKKNSKRIFIIVLSLLFIAIIAVVIFVLIKEKIIFNNGTTVNSTEAALIENNRITNSQVNAGQAAATGNYDSAVKTIDDQLKSTTDKDIRYRLFMQKSAILVEKSDFTDAYEAALSAYQLEKTSNSASNVAYVLAKMKNKKDAIAYYKIAISLIDSNDPMSGSDKDYYQSLINGLEK